MDRIEEYIGKKIFYLNGVPDPTGNWAGFFAGHYKEIQQPQWECADRQHLHGTAQADIIIAGMAKYLLYGDTRDPIINVVGATTIMRSWRNKPVLRKGGVIILASKCDGHIDPVKHPSYIRALELFEKTHSAEALETEHFESLISNAELLDRYHHHHAYSPIHAVWLFNENQYALDHAARVIIATADNPEAPARAGAEYAPTVEEALERAVKTTGPDPRILVLPNFFSYVPMLFLVE
jgi:hypothetical protein